MRSKAPLLTLFLASVSVLVIVFSVPVSAVASDPVQELQFRDGHFEPATLTIDANAPVKLRVKNAAANPIEFESFELNRERIVPPGQVITVFLPSLSPGTYHFFDDFHRDVPQGTLIAK
jgi:hypothetical protein